MCSGKQHLTRCKACRKKVLPEQIYLSQYEEHGLEVALRKRFRTRKDKDFVAPWIEMFCDTGTQVMMKRLGMTEDQLLKPSKA